MRELCHFGGDERGWRPIFQLGTAQAHRTAVAKARRLFLKKSTRSANSADSVQSGRWTGHLFLPVDVASIAVFRISFGLLLLYDMCKYYARGWIKFQYIDPPYHFAFFGFDFIRPLPGGGMYFLFAWLAICAVLITLGLFYRIAIAGFFIGFTYLFLIDQALYLNHFYLVALLAFLMIFVPAARGWSLDAILARRPQAAMVPGWSLWILRVQVEILLIYAGIVKINADWLQGEPLGTWLAARSYLPIMGPLLLNDRIILLGAWGVVLLHLIGAVLLLFRSTRLYVFGVYCVFHILNHIFFNIGIFPWLTIASTLLFFDPSWPRTLWQKLSPPFHFATAAWLPEWSGKATLNPWPLPSRRMRGVIVILIVGWTIIQVLVPLRHHLYAGNTSWHEQGHWFSWQMMLREKRGHAVFYVSDPDTLRWWLVVPRRSLTPNQYAQMAARPEMIRQFAHYLEKVWAVRYGTRDVEVRAFTAVSLNGRSSQALVDPTRDLSEIGYTFGNSDWILPLTEPMPPKAQRWQTDQTEALGRYLRTDPEVRRLMTSGQPN